MFLPCTGCADPYTCSDKFECKKERQAFDACDLEGLAEKIWTNLYPDRSPWEKLTNDTKQEWVRFTATAFAVFESQH